MKLTQEKGYSKEEYFARIGNVKPRILIGQGLEERPKFDTTTQLPVKTGEIESKRAWLYYPGLGVQSLKLPASYELSKSISDLEEVDLEEPEACVFGRELYVRAKGLKAK